jgi:hypothetical protein
MDVRAMLKKADALLGSGDIHGAVAAYTTVAHHFAAQGAAIKAIAIWKQVRTIAARESEPTFDADARAQLITLYRSIALEADALALEAEGETRH